MRIRFRPKKTIRRVVETKSIVAFGKTGEYDGELMTNGIIVSESPKCRKKFKLRSSDVNIVSYL